MRLAAQLYGSIMNSDNHVCLTCIGDDHLRTQAAPTAGVGDCEYCDAQNVPGITVAELCGLVLAPLQAHVVHGESMAHFDGDSDRPSYEQEGNDLNAMLQEEVGVDDELADHLADELVDSDGYDPSDGDTPFFSGETNYVRRYVSSEGYGELWNEFCERVKHQRRFFDDDAKAMLARLLGDGAADPTIRLPAMAVGPGTPIPHLYRARRARTTEEAESFLKHRAKELGPPPSAAATAGRMNSQGIAVFYGAVTEDTAVSEIRPSVGGLAVVGKFLIPTPLRLLDLSRIREQFTGSVFAPNYADRAARCRFLEGFHARIARPVLPHEEQIEYLPTQAVAEYVHAVLGFDGILYASVQLGEIEEPEPSHYVTVVDLTKEELARHNVVLLGATGRALRIVEAEAVRVTAIRVEHRHEFVGGVWVRGA